MRYKCFLVVIISLLLINISKCFCQNDWKPGYVITNKNDTVYGLIDNQGLRNNSINCCFRKDQNSNNQVFTPNDLFGYRIIDYKYFISKKIKIDGNDKVVFLEFLIKGKLNVYHYKDLSDRYYVEKDSSIYELKNTSVPVKINGTDYMQEKNEYKGILSFLLSDAKMSNDIQNVQLSSAPLISLAKKYNEIVSNSDNCIIYEKMKPPIKVKFGIHAGLYRNSITFNDELSSNYVNGYLIGCRFEFENIFASLENLSLVLDLNCQYFNNYKLTALATPFNWNTGDDYPSVVYNGVYYSMFMYGTTNLNVSLNTLVLKIPFTVNYTFRKGFIRPYAGIGLMNCLVLTQNKDFIEQDFSNVYGKSIPTYQIGFIGKIGNKFILKNNHSIYLELDYDYAQSNNVAAIFSNNMSSLLVGFSF